MGITIKDVAAVAGVSPATVSRFLTGNAKVAEDTAQQIRMVIEDLGYQPDRVARALRQRKTQLLGYVVPNLNNLMAMQLLIALEREASERGFLIALSSVGNLASAEPLHIERMVAQGIDGLFMLPMGGHATSEMLARAIEDEVPVVQIAERVNGISADFVGIDFDAGMQALVRYLRRDKQHKLAFIGEGATSYMGETQLKAFTNVVRANSDLILRGVKVGGYSAEFGRLSTNLLLAQNEQPQSIICGNENIAEGCLQAIHNHPALAHDVRVLAFGNTHPLIRNNSAIMMAGFPYADVAQEAMRVMLQRLSGLAGEPLSIGITPNLRMAASIK